MYMQRTLNHQNLVVGVRKAFSSQLLSIVTIF
jgi:hypothetical protein